MEYLATYKNLEHHQECQVLHWKSLQASYTGRCCFNEQLETMSSGYINPCTLYGGFSAHHVVPLSLQ